MNLYTIGFKERTAKDFFDTLIKHGIKRVIDIRVNNNSMDEGYARASDLEYFLEAIANAKYFYMPDLAPTENLRLYFRQGMLDYRESYIKLLEEREVLKTIDWSKLEDGCLICSGIFTKESDREVVGEYLKQHNEKMKLIHL